MIFDDIIKIFIPATLAFIVGIGIAPLLTHYLYRYKVWKKTSARVALDGTNAVEFEKLRTDVETKTPRMGGILIWASVFLVTLGIWFIDTFASFAFVEKLNFLSRSQTWIPLWTLLAGALIGFINDMYDIQPGGGQGIRLRTRLLCISVIALVIGWWFFDKLEVVSVGIPFLGSIEIGWLIIPLFVFVTLSLYAGGVIDGIDGLAGGVFAAIFASYTGIAFFQNQINLAAFCATVVGAILAFLWFNIPPARFWMTETGTMGLTMTLAVVAFMTDTLGEGYGLAALPIVAFPLLATVLSNIIQVLSKKFRGKKVFLIAPLHHHFEALGWPSYKITMRYWVLSAVCAVVGMTIALVK